MTAVKIRDYQFTQIETKLSDIRVAIHYDIELTFPSNFFGIINLMQRICIFEKT